jgi:O-antigen/teichoic acid export membrane protein
MGNVVQIVSDDQLETTGDASPAHGPSDLAVVGPDLGTLATEDPAQPATDDPRPATEDPPRLARNLGALAGGQLVTWTMTLAWTLIVPKALGPVGLGILVSAQSVSGVLTIVLGLGTRNYLVRETVINPAEGPKLVGTAIVVRLMLAPVVGLAAVIWARVAHDGHTATVVLYLITAVAILTLLAEPLQAGFQALERMKYLAYGDIINKSAQSLIGIMLVIVGFRTVAIAANMAIIAGVVFVLYLLWLRPILRIDIRTNTRRVTGMARQSLAYWSFGLFGYFYFWIDTILLSLMTRSQVVGWYGATTQIFQTLMFLPVLVSTAWLPRLVAAFTQGREHLIKAARAPIELILLISIPIAAGTAMTASVLIHAVYGAAFSNAVPVMVVLAFCIPPIFMNIMLSLVLLAEKRQAVWAAVMAGAAVFNPLLNLVLIPLTETRYHNGAIGAAVSLVITELVMDIVGFLLVGRRVFDRGVIRRLVLVLAASAGMWGVFVALRPLGTPASIAAASATFVLLALIFRVATDEEVAMMRSALARLRGRLLARPTLS